MVRRANNEESQVTDQPVQQSEDRPPGVSSPTFIDPAKADAAPLGHEAAFVAENICPEILKGLPVACYALNAEGWLIFCNDEAKRLCGRSPEVGKEQWACAGRLFELDGKALSLSMCAAACALRERRSIRGMETILERPDGSRRNVVDNADPFFDQQGNCLGVVNIQLDVTDEREAQQTLQRSEARFREIADHAPAMIWFTDPEAHCTFLSRSWCEFTGKTQESGLGSGWLNSIHPDDREPTLALSAAAKARREEFLLEYRLLHAGGTYRRVLMVATPRFDTKDEFLGYIGSILDISGHGQVNESAQSAAQRLQLATEATALGTWDYFPATKFLIWDVRCKELFGLPSEATVDYEAFLSALHPDDRLGVEAALERTLDPSGDGTMEIEYRTIGIVDHIERWVCVNGRAFFDKGTPTRVVGTIQDISDRKKAEDAMQRLAAIVESSEDAIISKDLNGIIMTWNKGAVRIFGYRPDEVLGKPITILIPLERHDEETEILRKIRRGDRVEHYETIRVRKNGARIDVSLTVSPLRDKSGVIIGASKIARDITERKRTVRELEQARDTAEAANRSKDKFLAVLSHELRTPLTPVLMTVALRERDPNLSQTLRADMTMIRRNVELETKLIDDLLDLSRITSGKLNLRLQSVDLNTSIRQVCDICRSQIQEKGIRLYTDLDATTEPISADSSRLQQVLWNVLKNAAKFTPDGGTIQVKTSQLRGSRVRVQICDSGAGIAADKLTKIFDAFEQGDARVTRQFGGLGLGLAISKALIELHRGSIRVESDGVGAGCTVTIEMPAAGYSKENVSIGDLSGAGRLTKPLHLLIVEDHADTALLLKRLLETSGFVVETRGTVGEALQATERKTFDVLVSDLGLPDGTGYELMRQIRARFPMKGIAMSGYGMDEDIRKSIAAGFSEHLVKPVDISALERAILSLVPPSVFEPQT